MPAAPRRLLCVRVTHSKSEHQCFRSLLSLRSVFWYTVWHRGALSHIILPTVRLLISLRASVLDEGMRWPNTNTLIYSRVKRNKPPFFAEHWYNYNQIKCEWIQNATKGHCSDKPPQIKTSLVFLLLCVSEMLLLLLWWTRWWRLMKHGQWEIVGFCSLFKTQQSRLQSRNQSSNQMETPAL